MIFGDAKGENEREEILEIQTQILWGRKFPSKLLDSPAGSAK